MEKLAQVDINKKFFGGDTPLSDPKNVGGLITNFVGAALAVAGVILLFILVGGGVAMVIGAGNNNPETAAKGKKAATSALIGFILVFASFWIVRLIELITGLTILGT